MPHAVLLPMLVLSFLAGGCLASAWWLRRVERLERALRWERRQAFSPVPSVRGRIAVEGVG